MKPIQTNPVIEIFHPELSYELVGMLFSVHNELGSYAREKQYGDYLEKILKENNLSYRREYRLGDTNNIIDFLVEDKVILELKSKRIIVKEDYEQVQRYLQASGIKLALLVNFRDKYIKPRRVIKISR